MMTVVIETDYVMHLSALNVWSDWLLLWYLSLFNGLFTAVCRQIPTRKQCRDRETVRCCCRVRYLQRHCVVLPAI